MISFFKRFFGRRKRTTIQTLPYERFVSNHVMLNAANVKVGRETVNLYSKSYLVEDINYSVLTEDEQEVKLRQYSELLNNYDSTVSVQISLVNLPMNTADSESLMLHARGDGHDHQRQEFNSVIRGKIMDGQKGLECRKIITVTVAAVDFETANTRLYNFEQRLNRSLAVIGTKAIPLTANDRVRLMADILCNPDKEISPVSRSELNRQAEKQLCCPDSFEFKKDWFMIGDKYARCIYIKRLGSEITDNLYPELLELNLQTVISENIDFVDQAEALKLVQRKLTDMKQEELTKKRKSAETAKGAYIDPIEGTALETDKLEAKAYLEKLQGHNVKMTRVQFLMMILADSMDELKSATDKVNTVLRGRQIEMSAAPLRQEVAFDSCLPIGNSCGIDKEQNLQVRRTLDTDSTAIFMPFQSRELMHENGIYFGQNRLSRSVILFDRMRLNNPNSFIFGMPGSGKSMLAKLMILYIYLSQNDEILIVDPEREYAALVELLGGEVIYMSENSGTHINPLDLTENPDADDKEYNPVKAKLDFLLSFFSAIMGDAEITPIQKTIIDSVMHSTSRNYPKPTLREYYDELLKYEQEATEETRPAAAYLRQTLHLYVHGSMNVFAHETNVNIHKRIVAYDIKELGKNMQTLSMMIVLENIWDRVAKNRAKGINTQIFCDELYLLFKSEQSANFFYELYKRARKWGGVPCGITQNVDDLLRSELARTMISNTQFVVMLGQNETDREQLANLLHIPKETMDTYLNGVGAGCGMIYAGDYGVIPFDNSFPTDTDIYRTITTKFSEVMHRAEDQLE
ncbi:MAG: ATP-binding protein [Oscillospiraceae bacterium]|nr:ATP-binding protein [Oscillospiraceae bacterium]